MRKNVGAVETNLGWTEPVRRRRNAADVSRRGGRLPARNTRTALALGGRADDDDSHLQGRRFRIPVGEGMVPGTGICETHPPGGPGHYASVRRAVADTGARAELVLVPRSPVHSLVLSK